MYLFSYIFTRPSLLKKVVAALRGIELDDLEHDDDEVFIIMEKMLKEAKIQYISTHWGRSLSLSPLSGDRVDRLFARGVNPFF